MSREKNNAIRLKLTSARRSLLDLLHTLHGDEWDTIVYSEEGDWRVSDVLRHLTDAERGMTGLIERVQGGGHGVPPDFDLGRWNARVIEKAKDKSPEMLMSEMDVNRAHLLQILETLGDDDWEKQGRHASLRILSIEQILHLIADHESRHTEDIRRALP